MLPTDNGPDLSLSRTSTGSSPLGLGVEVKAEREKPLLKDPGEIKEHVYNVMRKSLPTLTKCYEDRLKENGAVRGKWRISFVITREGKPVEADAKGISMGDEPLENCIRGKIGRWSFFRLPNDQPVSKSVTFMPR